MKILAIRGKNLASLEGEFTIDFTSEPLVSAGIFAITGNTGAGKSTILDALCVALFDDTPRSNKASENVAVYDVEEKTISQKDCRNILRRGIGEGYAEVEFIALNGKKYRSRWTVRRAHGKANKPLQNTVMELTNLTDLSEEQGTKTDLLKRITELIGLSFSQFTRAVLLAQGDFATFLKAKQSEKAELLEKLTGTEIYSEISKKIHLNTKEAEKELELIQKRIEDIKLLTDEELDVLAKEKDELEKVSKDSKEQLLVLEKKLSWLKQETELKSALKDMETNLEKAKILLEQAKPRYEYILQVDRSLEIRDSYLDLKNRKKQVDNSLLLLKKNQESLKVKDNELKDISEQLSHLHLEKRKLEEEYEILKPKIEQAKKLDNEIESLLKHTKESQNEYERQILIKSNIEKSISSLKNNSDKLKTEHSQIKSWLDKHSEYKSLVSRADLTLKLLEDLSIASKYKSNYEKNLSQTEDLLSTQLKKLGLFEEELSRLESLLPSEVIILRKRLENGKACPVCGSENHPFTHVDYENRDEINAETLEIEKEKVKENITKEKQKIDLSRNETIQLKTSIDNYKKQYEDVLKDLSKELEFIEDWKGLLDENKLQTHIKTITIDYKNKELKQQGVAEQYSAGLIKLEAEEKALDTAKTEESRVKNIFETNNNQLSEYRKKRNELFAEKTEDIEHHYGNKKAENDKAIDAKNKLKNILDQDKAQIVGQIKKTEEDIVSYNKEIVEKQKEVSYWLQNSSHSISSDLLEELVAKSPEWINQEKESLTILKESVLKHKSSLDERQLQMEKHNLSEAKPSDEETKEYLLLQQNETTQKENEIKKRLVEIEVSLTQHINGKNRIKSFEKELTEKTYVCENWQKLNTLFGSADGNRFKTIAQGYTLDILLNYANLHLKDLAPRYVLEKIHGTLALQVIDNDMLGEIRTVHSLSGGESFLISLALALALSSLSSNKMKIESLFIDEGFGSLDIDTLSLSMSALENLQTQGRKIGVISHVTEMTERIPVRVHVEKISNGKSKIMIR